MCSNKIIKNVSYTYIPHETVCCNYKVAKDKK